MRPFKQAFFIGTGILTDNLMQLLGFRLSELCSLVYVTSLTDIEAAVCIYSLKNFSFSVS
jgi:hypothetical protein